MEKVDFENELFRLKKEMVIILSIISNANTMRKDYENCHYTKEIFTRYIISNIKARYDDMDMIYNKISILYIKNYGIEEYQKVEKEIAKKANEEIQKSIEFYNYLQNE